MKKERKIEGKKGGVAVIKLIVVIILLIRSPKFAS